EKAPRSRPINGEERRFCLHDEYTRESLHRSAKSSEGRVWGEGCVLRRRYAHHPAPACPSTRVQVQLLRGGGLVGVRCLLLEFQGSDPRHQGDGSQRCPSTILRSGPRTLSTA